MSRRTQQKAESRSAIIRSGARILRHQGVAGMSVEKAMAGAGLTVGAFYAHFASKQDLLDHSFTEAMTEIESVMRAAARGRVGRAALVDVAATYLSEEHRERARSGCPLPAVAGEAASSGTRSVRAMLAKGLGTMHERLLALGNGEITADGALALASLMVGGQILARATRGTPVSSRVLAACRDAARRLLEPEAPAELEAT